MKLTTDQLISWFYTAVVAAGLFPPDSESKVREAMAKVPKGELRGLRSGMKQGINDILWRLLMMPNATAIDAALRARGLPSVREMHAEMTRKEDKMLRRGVLKDDEEFYLAKELLDNLESGLTGKQRARVGRMVHAYEERARTANERE